MQLLTKQHQAIAAVLLASVLAVRSTLAQECDLECPDGIACLLDSSTNEMHCDCPSNLTGQLCDIQYITCDGDHRCFHGGQCISGLRDTYGNDHMFCNCDQARDEQGNRYVGKFCEHRAINYCDLSGDNYCVNTGECTGNLQYPCDCPDGFVGKHCEYREEEVPDCSLECENGGVCRLGSRSQDDSEAYQYWDDEESRHMRCECPPEYDGKLCEISKDTCGDDHCFNGSQCMEYVVEGEIRHGCDCGPANQGDASYAGRFCQFKADQYCTKEEGLNGHLFCVNKGTCKTDPYSGCNCLPGYAGFSCEFVEETEPYLPPGTHEDEPESPPPAGGWDGIENGRTIVDPEVECGLVCQNGGKCKKGVKDFGQLKDVAPYTSYMNETYNENLEHCVCRGAYTGLHCEYRAQVCNEGEHVCLHGGECVQDGESHACDCDNAVLDQESMNGRYCEHVTTDICTIDSMPGQVLSFCVNGGTCLKKVQSGEPHPGCLCEEGWKGPHCEIHETQLIKTTSAKPSSNGSTGDGGTSDFGIVVLVVSLMAIVVVSAFFLDKYRRHRRAKRSMSSSAVLWKNGAYRDGPPEVNIAPRRQSEYIDNVYMDSITSATRSGSQDEGEDEPQVFIGPPRDEDGHELHNVDIL